MLQVWGGEERVLFVRMLEGKIPQEGLDIHGR
jgi:hypothetical protein